MLGQSVGLTAEEMAAMAVPDTCTSFDVTDRLVLRYAEVLTRDVRVEDVLYAELEDRFTCEELVTLCMTIALAAMVTRVHATFLTDLDESTRSVVGDVPACPIGH